MNDMTYTHLDQSSLVNQSSFADQTNAARTQTQFLTEQLEYLWLLSALESGFEQAKRSETVVANTAFFDALETRLFGKTKEEVIKA